MTINEHVCALAKEQMAAVGFEPSEPFDRIPSNQDALILTFHKGDEVATVAFAGLELRKNADVLHTLVKARCKSAIATN